MIIHNGAVMRAEKLDSSTRRRQILEAALQLIAEAGANRLNMAGLARRVGLVTSGLYRHFDSKDAVLDAAIGLIGQRLQSEVEAARQEGKTALDQLRQLLRRHVALIRTNAGIPRLVFSEAVFSDDPSRRQNIRRVIERYMDQISALIHEGQKSGQIRNDLDPRTVAVMFLGLVQPMAILWRVTDGRFDVTRHTHKSWEIFEAMLRPDSTGDDA